MYIYIYICASIYISKFDSENIYNIYIVCFLLFNKLLFFYQVDKACHFLKTICQPRLKQTTVRRKFMHISCIYMRIFLFKSNWYLLHYLITIDDRFGLLVPILFSDILQLAVYASFIWNV